jgi:preprotein translocase SecE subunit
MALHAERLKATSGDAPESRTGALWERIKEHPKRWGEFLHEVRVELRQVTWPTRHEVVVTTFGVFFFGVDSTVGWLLNRLFTIFKH